MWLSKECDPHLSWPECAAPPRRWEQLTRVAHLREEQLSGGLAASLPPETALPVSAPQLESPGGIFFISNLYEGGRALGASSRARAARQIPPPPLTTWAAAVSVFLSLWFYFTFLAYLYLSWHSLGHLAVRLRTAPARQPHLTLLSYQPIIIIHTKPSTYQYCGVRMG